MTEEEKESIIASAKARIAKHAVTAATVISTLSPAISNAQAMSENASDNSPAPIEQTVSAAPSDTIVTSLDDTPAFGSDEWLRAQMHADREEHDAAVIELTTAQVTERDMEFAAEMDADIPEYLEQRQDIINRLNTPAASDDDYGYVGNWNSYVAVNYSALLNMNKPADGKDEGTLEYEKYIRQKRADYSKSSTPVPEGEERPQRGTDYVSQMAPENPLEDNALAYLDKASGKIFMMKYTDLQKARTAGQNDHQSQYIQNNQIAQTATLYHENTHRKHFLYDAVELSRTPINAAKANRLTETTAKAVEYLSVAMQYSTLRQQGLETLQTEHVEALSDVLDRFAQSGKTSFGEFLNEQNITEISINNERTSVESLSDIFPNMEQTSADYILFKNAKITFGEGDEAETDVLCGFAGDADKKPLTEYLDSFAQSTNLKISSIEIDGEKMSYEEFKSRYPNINDIARNYAQIQNICSCSMQEIPLDNVLDLFPGLRENIPETGFDPNNAEHVGNIVRAAADNWHNDAESLAAYNRQSADLADAAAMDLSYFTWSEQLEILKNQDTDYENASARMLKDLYIGQNQTVDLTAYRDLLDTMTTENARTIIAGHNEFAANDDHTGVITYEEMMQIDSYLESIGLTNDEAKMTYMADFINSSADRTNTHHDDKLYNIMMSYSACLGYTDGLAVELKDNQIIGRNCAERYDLTGMITLPQTLSTEMGEARHQHDLDLDAATRELTSPAPQTEHDTPAASDRTQTISPAVLMQMQPQR